MRGQKCWFLVASNGGWHRIFSISMARGNSLKTASGSMPNFETHLWAAADRMRGHMDASEYKHVCLGLTLAALRDALLPKLLSGGWRVRDAAKLVEATA